MDKKILTFNFSSEKIKDKKLSDYNGQNFIERVKNMAKDMEQIRKQYFFYTNKLLPEINKIKYPLNSKNFIENIVLIENKISEFLDNNFKIKSFYIANTLMKKIKNDFDYNLDLSFFDLLLEQLGVFIKKIDLNKIPYIPKSNLYSTSENGVLYADLIGGEIIFKFEYLTGEKYIKEYVKNSILYNLVKDNELLEKKYYILENTKEFDGEYFEVLKNGIFEILDLLKRNKSKVFGEVFYDKSISKYFSNQDFLIDLNDFLLEFKDVFKSNSKLNILFKILKSIIENTYQKSLIDIEADLGINLDIKSVQLLKTELFLFIEKIKTIN